MPDSSVPLVGPLGIGLFTTNVEREGEEVERP
jgi:hypothetical protein